jgi:hypothetical protein
MMDNADTMTEQVFLQTMNILTQDVVFEGLQAGNVSGRLNTEWMVKCHTYIKHIISYKTS